MDYEGIMKEFSELISKYMSDSKPITEDKKEHPSVKEDTKPQMDQTKDNFHVVKPKSKFITIQVDADDPDTAKVVYNNAFVNDEENCDTLLALVRALSKVASDSMGGSKDDENNITAYVTDVILHYSIHNLTELLFGMRRNGNDNKSN